MERAAEEARAGNLLYFQGLPADRLAPLLRRADADGRSLFHSACASGSLPLAQFLLDHGAPAEQAKQADEEGWTPLHSAVSAGHEPVARLLLGLGADPSAATQQQRTALHYAASKGQAALVDLLLQAGAAPGAKDCTGATALHRAAATGRTDIISLLLAADPKLLDRRNADRATPLLLACLAGHQGAAILLASKGADVEAEDGEGETPLGAAAAHGKLRDALAGIAKGELSADDFMLA